MFFPKAKKSGGHMMRKNVLVIFGTVLAVGMLLAGCGNSSESSSAAREENSYVEGTQDRKSVV